MEERNTSTKPVAGPPLPAARGGAAPAAGNEASEILRAQLSAIRDMDPEMNDLPTILESEAGEKFRNYVRMGLDFVDAYTLAAREKLQALRDRKAAAALREQQAEAAFRAGAAGKRHLAATASRGEGSVNVPPRELEMMRLLNPDVSDAEIRRYYNLDRKRFGR